MQYYHKTIDNTPHRTICEIDTIDETSESIVTYCMYASFGFILFQRIDGVMGCLIIQKSWALYASGGSVGLVPHKIKMNVCVLF